MNSPAAFRTPFVQAKWAVCLGIALIAVLIAFFPHQLLRYERQSIFFDEPWRLLTAHLVHLGPAHLILNMAGLALICGLFWKDLPVRHGAAVLLTAAGSIDLLLWWFHPQVQWYAGLSGIVHALWAAGVISTLFQPQTSENRKYRLMAMLGGVFLLIKLTGERTGIVFSNAHIETFPVLDIVHTYGALTGAAYALLWHQAQKRRQAK